MGALSLSVGVGSLSIFFEGTQWWWWWGVCGLTLAGPKACFHVSRSSWSFLAADAPPPAVTHTQHTRRDETGAVSHTSWMGEEAPWGTFGV